MLKRINRFGEGLLRAQLTSPDQQQRREQRIIYEDRMFAADEEGQGAGTLTPVICPLENKFVAAHFLF